MSDLFTANIYGNQVTRKFSDIFVDADTFLEEWQESGIAERAEDSFNYTLTDGDVRMTFYLLYGRFGNSHIASFDENQFKYKLWTIMFQHGASWAKKIQLQSELRALNLEDIANSKTIHNHSYNPSIEPSTAALEELPTINEQNTSTYKKAKGDSYAIFMSLLDTDYTERYLARFKKLFLTFVYPAGPLWYVTED